MLKVFMTDSHALSKLKKKKNNQGGGVASTEWLCTFVAIDTFRNLFRATDTCDVFSFDKDGCQSLKLSASLWFFFQTMLEEHLNRYSIYPVPLFQYFVVMHIPHTFSHYQDQNIWSKKKNLMYCKQKHLEQKKMYWKGDRLLLSRFFFTWSSTNV